MSGLGWDDDDGWIVDIWVWGDYGTYGWVVVMLSIWENASFVKDPSAISLKTSYFEGD